MAKYTIRKNRIRSGCIEGFTCDDQARLELDQSANSHGVFLRGIDGAKPDAEWGRLTFDVECSEDRAYSIYLLAVNQKVHEIGGVAVDLDVLLTKQDIPVDQKKYVLKKLGAVRYIGRSDILLYELTGQYLYIAILAAGHGHLAISRLTLDSVGDNFMATYPEIYRERNSFFHRYISIFSSIYNDFERDIERLPQLLDPDVCPRELLIVYGSWLGIDLEGGSLDDDMMRVFVKEAYNLNRLKGTKRAIERVLEIILGRPAVVIEHNRLRAWIKEDKIEIPEGFKTQGIYDVTVMVPEKLTEELRHRIVYMLNQFKPIRTRISIVQMDETPMADSRTYLDINSRLPEERAAELDSGLSLDGTVILK
jgi:phage tail-like protein